MRVPLLDAAVVFVFAAAGSVGGAADEVFVAFAVIVCVSAADAVDCAVADVAAHPVVSVAAADSDVLIAPAAADAFADGMMEMPDEGTAQAASDASRQSRGPRVHAALAVAVAVAPSQQQRVAKGGEDAAAEAGQVDSGVAEGRSRMAQGDVQRDAYAAPCAAVADAAAAAVVGSAPSIRAPQ
jgi:hypothetical protein